MLQEQPNNLTTYVCRHVFEKKRPTVYVFTSKDGTVSMLCEGANCDPEEPSNCSVVGLGHMREYEPALAELNMLPVSTEAYLGQNKQWVFTPALAGSET